jgi:hypothetical protein
LNRGVEGYREQGDVSKADLYLGQEALGRWAKYLRHY